MGSQAGHGSSAASGSVAGVDRPWQHERAVRAAVRDHWGLRDELRRMQARAASRTWQAGGHVVKLARDEPSHFTAGLLASETVEQAGVATGAPRRTGTGELCVPLVLGRESWALAVLHRVDGGHRSVHGVPPAIPGEFLGRLHRILRNCPVAGAWTPGDVLGHMTRGITAAHPLSARRMITQAVSDVSAYYATAPPVQLLYGDGPGIFSADGTGISAIID
jgi:Ser/Thr protein kinase RdoA (MazF antagonist)